MAYPKGKPRPPGAGRKKGTPNKATKTIREAWVEAFNLVNQQIPLHEWGAANPTKSTAIKRVDNYGAGFLRGGAKAVFASGITNVAYVVRGLFTAAPSMIASSRCSISRCSSSFASCSARATVTVTLRSATVTADDGEKPWQMQPKPFFRVPPV